MNIIYISERMVKTHMIYNIIHTYIHIYTYIYLFIYLKKGEEYDPSSIAITTH